MPPIPKSQSAFSLKAAGRTLSFGRTNKTSTPTPLPQKELPSPPSDEEESPYGRARAVTASSYASTATPPKLDERDMGLSLGGDFGQMFAGFGKRKSPGPESNDRAVSKSPVSLIFEVDGESGADSEQDTLPSEPTSRSYSSSRLNQPSPLNIDRGKDVEASPYSWSSQHSQDGLISNSSPPPFVPRNEEHPPPVPQHGPARANNGSPSTSKQQRPGGSAEKGLRRSSGVSARRQSTLEYGDLVDEDARLLRESVNASRRLNDPSNSSKVRDSWALPSSTSYNVDDAVISGWKVGSVETTPRAKQAEPRPHEENLFDSQMAASASLAQLFQEQSLSAHTRDSPQSRVMTPAQFERYKQDQERLRSVGGQSKDEYDDDETYDDDEDEAEKNRQLVKQRRKQEAHMAVYRQQMMKVTGETPPAAGPTRPGVFATQSSPNLVLSSQAEEGEEEDEEIPLAILQAHGFPSKNKPPMQSMGSNPNLRSQSVVGGADGRLPVFARNLPEDPYFGAGLVNPMHRESLAFGGGVTSVNSGPSRGMPPGGLVGVIATEERSRAMRRGSPNAQGEYAPLPPNGFNPMGMLPNMQSSTMGNMINGMGPMGPMGPMNPMMLTPGDQAQIQMSQQMQQFMQMQVQFMQMMTSGQGVPQQNGHMSQQSMGEVPRSSSPHLRPASSHQRAMTMMEPNAAPWMRQGGAMYTPSMRAHGVGYAPSIAPSERSNVGLPGRYRPVSYAPPPDNKSRASTMSGALQGWENKNGSATTKTLKKSGNVSDEDDEEGWEEMAKKREKKKSIWRTKKDTNGLKDMFHFVQ